jgi:hypothetical protein
MSNYFVIMLQYISAPMTNKKQDRVEGISRRDRHTKQAMRFSKYGFLTYTKYIIFLITLQRFVIKKIHDFYTLYDILCQNNNIIITL